MRRRQEHRPHHESPHEARLREVVDELIPDTERRQEYLQFARELDLSLRRPLRRRNRYFPDFSTRTKRVVARWFRRRLSGRVMWRIGEALTGRALPGGRR